MDSLKQEIKKELVLIIKNKKELLNLDDSFIEEKIDKALLNNKKIRKKLFEIKEIKNLKRSKEVKNFISEIRRVLRQIYGVFDLDIKNKKQELIIKLGENYSQRLMEELLELHQSTIERIPYYEQLFEEIASRNKGAKTILDLGCGFNPYATRLLEEKLGVKIDYYASDISTKNMIDIKKYFSLIGVKGDAKAIDLVTNYQELKTFPPKKVDLVLMFKLLDSLETIKKNVSEKIIDLLLTKAKGFVVSFPTRSLGGNKVISNDKRVWFEKLLERKNLVYETFELPNEIFYFFRNKDF